MLLSSLVFLPVSCPQCSTSSVHYTTAPAAPTSVPPLFCQPRLSRVPCHPAFDRSNILHPRERVLSLSFLNFPPLFLTLNPVSLIPHLLHLPSFCVLTLSGLQREAAKNTDLITSAYLPTSEQGLCKAELTLSSGRVPACRSSRQCRSRKRCASEICVN